MIKKVVIIGFGVYGKSIYSLLAKDHSMEVSIISNHFIPSEAYPIVDLIDYSIASNYDIAIITTSSRKLNKTLDELVKHKFSGLILNFVKAITESGLFSTKIESLNLSDRYGYIAGAAFAKDILSGSSVKFCLSSKNRDILKEVKHVFSDRRVTWTYYNNPEMAELISALKNVYSIYMGYQSQIMDLATDRVNFLLECFNELEMITTELQCDRKILFTTAGFGDLVLSGTSLNSRNFFYGYSLSKGYDQSYSSELSEGTHTVNFLKEVLPEHIRENLKIVNQINEIINGKEKPQSRLNKRVLTYGTFDLFHYGHLELLRRAKNRGSYLIVGLSTDSFNESKGKTCVQPYEVRERNLLSLNIVDEVIPEESWSQKPKDIKYLNVDLFVMGSDWNGEFDDLEKFCSVEYLTRTEGISTTIIKKNLGIIN